MSQMERSASWPWISSVRRARSSSKASAGHRRPMLGAEAEVGPERHRPDPEPCVEDHHTDGDAAGGVADIAATGRHEDFEGGKETEEEERPPCGTVPAENLAAIQEV